MTMAALLLTTSANAQFPEGFETAVPPAGWAMFTANSATPDWVQSGGGAAHTGASGATITKWYEAVDEIFLATPQFTPAAGEQLTVYEKDFYTYLESEFSIRVSTGTQMDPNGYTTVLWSRGGGTVGNSWSLRQLDLSAFAGTPIHVAFVVETLTASDRSWWVLDDVDLNTPSGPPNDICSSISTVPLIDGVPLVLTGDVTGATGDVWSTLPTVWHRFTTTDCLMDVEISFCGTTPAMSSAYTTMYNGGCALGQSFTGTGYTACGDGNTYFSFAALPAGTYTIPVYGNLPGTSTYTMTVTGNATGADTDGDGIVDACDACPLALDGLANFNTTTCGCDPGYYQTITDMGGNDVITACTICPAGSFCADGVDAVLCPTGRYSALTGQTACVDCAAGSFNAAQGATSCTLCPAGFANPLTGASSCQPCEAGEYSDQLGSENCASCPAGTFNGQMAQTSCTACPNGESSGVGATECTPDVVCNDYVLEFQSGAANANAVTYEVLDETGTVTVLSGNNPVPANGVGTQTLCLVDGCYQLRVTDAAGDGLLGYELRESGTNGSRIIDNNGNMSNGSSSIANGGTFCVPIGAIDLIYSNCDKLDWVNYQYLVCHADPLVSAEWQVGNQNNDGYNFWIFDPNGTYSFRRFHTHAVSDGFSPASATRAARIKINGWNNGALTPHIPTGVLLNVRVRGVYNWNFTEWGPTCTMMIDPAAAACPQVRLQDDPSNTSDFSCGVTRSFGGSNSGLNKLTAKPPQFQPAPLAGGTGVRYQFRFRLPGENVCIVRPAQTSPTLYLNWSAASGPQLEALKTYEVEVRVSKDQGATWCVDSPNPACDPSPVTTWGKTCSVTIGSVVTLAGESSSIATQGDGTISLYPNPNNGEQLFISLTELGAEVSTVNVDIYDMTGKRVAAHTIAVAEGFLNTALDLNGEVASGLYMVNITAGEHTYNERLVIQK
jgi:hypothetical protein